MRKFYFAFYIVALSFLLPSGVALASTTYHFTCADWVNTSGSNTCSGSTLNFPDNNATQQAEFHNFTYGSGTYYLSYTILTDPNSGQGVSFTQLYDGTTHAIDCGSSPACFAVGLHASISFTGTPGANLRFRQLTDRQPWRGTLNGICVSDTAGACEATAPSTPTFSPVAGTFTSAQTITITSTGADDIYYTLDGTTPSTSSTHYTGAVSVNSTKTLKAIGHNTAGDSSVASGLYTINIPSGGGGSSTIWNVASTTGAVNDSFLNIGTILMFVIGVLVGVLVSLMGLYFGMRKIKQYILGNSSWDSYSKAQLDRAKTSTRIHKSIWPG